MATKALDTVKALDKLKVLIPDTTVELSIGPVVLKPFKFKNLAIALELTERYAAIILSPKEIIEDDQKLYVSKTSLEVIQEILAKTGDSNYPVMQDVRNLLGLLSTDLAPEIVDDLGYDDVFLLLVEAFEINSDFFERLMVKLRKDVPETNPKEATEAVEATEADPASKAI